MQNLLGLHGRHYGRPQAEHDRNALKLGILSSAIDSKAQMHTIAYLCRKRQSIALTNKATHPSVATLKLVISGDVH